MLDFSKVLDTPAEDSEDALPRRAAIEALSKAEKIQVAGELLSGFTGKIRSAQEEGGIPEFSQEDFLKDSELEILEVMAEVLLDEARKRYAREQ